MEEEAYLASVTTAAGGGGGGGRSSRGGEGHEEEASARRATGHALLNCVTYCIAEFRLVNYWMIS